MPPRLFIFAGRLAIALAILALFGAWTTQLTGAPLLGMSQQHLFNDAIALSLIGIGLAFDGWLHQKKV